MKRLIMPAVVVFGLSTMSAMAYAADRYKKPSGHINHQAHSQCMEYYSNRPAWRIMCEQMAYEDAKRKSSRKT